MDATTTARIRSVRTMAAAMLAVAALSLTAACNNDDATGTKTEGVADSSAATNGQDASSSGSGDGTHGSGGSGGSGGSDANGGSKPGGVASDPKPGNDGHSADDDSAADDPGPNGPSADNDHAANDNPEMGPCDINKTAITIKSVKRPVNFMLVQATNKAGVDCALGGAPILKLSQDAQAPVPVNESTRLRSPIILSPGESAYAGFMTSAADGSGDNSVKVNSIKVFLNGTGNENNGKTVELARPTVTDSSAQVTYWQTEMQNALS